MPSILVYAGGINSVVKNRSFVMLVMLIAILFMGTLACSQSGRILTSAEATEMAQPTSLPTAELQGGYQVGDVVYLTNKSFLVSLMDEPGGNRMIAGQERGVQVEILQAAPVDGTLWYFIKAPTGQGWVPEENLTAEAP
jgi:hypothetical protein